MLSVRKNVIVCAICSFFIVIFLVISFWVVKLPIATTETNQQEMNATVDKIVEENNDFLIELKEYDCKLFVDSKTLLNKESFLSITPGNKIFFRLIDVEENILENLQIEQIFVVTLRTETQEFVTFESYKQEEEKGRRTIRTIGIIGSSILFVVVVFNFAIICKKKICK